MKTALRYLFDPAVQLMNRLSYPRKFAATGMLFALPLVFVTSQYIAMLNERVEISQRELVGNRAVRSIVPLWYGWMLLSCAVLWITVSPLNSTRNASVKSQSKLEKRVVTIHSRARITVWQFICCTGDWRRRRW